MEHIPELTEKDVKEVHERFEGRISAYKEKGMDFEKFREFLMDKAAPLENDILELGTGTGYTALTLAAYGYKFISIDTDEEALRTTAARLIHDKLLANAKFYIMDATKLDFADGSFRTVVAVNLLHHIDGLDRLLSEADRVLSPGGKLVLSDFNKEGRAIIDAFHREQGGSHDHPLADTAKIRSFFTDKGYAAEEFENYGHWILIAKKAKA